MRAVFSILVGVILLSTFACHKAELASGPITLKLFNETTGDLTEFVAFEQYIGFIPAEKAVIITVEQTVRNGQLLMEGSSGRWNGVQLYEGVGFCGTGAEAINSGYYEVDVKLFDVGNGTGVIFYLR